MLNVFVAVFVTPFRVAVTVAVAAPTHVICTGQLQV
jgi:hypothetical protein